MPGAREKFLGNWVPGGGSAGQAGRGGALQEPRPRVDGPAQPEESQAAPVWPAHPPPGRSVPAQTAAGLRQAPASPALSKGAEWKPRVGSAPDVSEVEAGSDPTNLIPRFGSLEDRLVQDLLCAIWPVTSPHCSSVSSAVMRLDGVSERADRDVSDGGRLGL